MKNKQKQNTADIALIHRLNRIQGQIDGLKRALAEKSDCLTTVGQVKAVHGAVKRFGEAYVENFMDRCAKDERVTPGFKKNIREVVRSAFTI